MTIAFWCVLVAALLPYVAFGFVTGLNPKAPRIGAPALEGRPARAYGAHLNAFESFPPFAAAVIIAHVVEGASATVDVLALLFIVARIAHMAFYIADRPPLRSTAWAVGTLIVVAIFIQTAFR